VTPIREYDDRTIGSGSRGPITKELQALYFDYVHGRRDDHKDWLSYV
jgi:branched-chain amino acid aminotransferase